MTQIEITADWEYIADRVMGGVSAGQMTQEMVQGRMATRLCGDVSLENNGGFVQIASDLPDIDASGWDGIMLDLCGNGESYDIRLRTDQLTRPWQSFRADFTARPDWQSLTFPFADFTPQKHDIPFDPAALRRVGILAIGRAFVADVAVAGLRLYRD
ncbi:CIA30 family protein [Yoonia sp.]|uniref:CIA30 family protein n=1 Tax=Yoonia sp. TaxID=2212373 RepID=UPI00391C189F